MRCARKTLVFAYHREVIDGLATALRRAGHNVVTFTGRTRGSTAVVQRFKQDPSCLFFIGNMRAAGIGITLTAASLVVFAELDWTPAIHHQAEDRASHRANSAGRGGVLHPRRWSVNRSSYLPRAGQQAEYQQTGARQSAGG